MALQHAGADQGRNDVDQAHLERGHPGEHRRPPDLPETPSRALGEVVGKV
jgi:hypothetical protein